MNFPKNSMISQKSRLEENIKKLDHYCKFLQIKNWDREDIMQETWLKALEAYGEHNITPALLKKSPIINGWI